MQVVAPSGYSYSTYDLYCEFIHKEFERAELEKPAIVRYVGNSVWNATWGSFVEPTAYCRDTKVIAPGSVTIGNGKKKITPAKKQTIFTGLRIAVEGKEVEVDLNHYLILRKSDLKIATGDEDAANLCVFQIHREYDLPAVIQFIWDGKCADIDSMRWFNKGQERRINVAPSYMSKNELNWTSGGRIVCYRRSTDPCVNLLKTYRCIPVVEKKVVEIPTLLERLRSTLPPSRVTPCKTKGSTPVVPLFTQ